MMSWAGLTFDRARGFRWPPRVAPAHARCFAEDDPEASGPAGLESSAAGEDLTSEKAPERDWRAEYLREMGQSRKYRQRAQKAEADLDELRSRALTPTQHEEYQRLRLSADSLADKDRRLERLEGTVRQVVGLNELTKALVACGVGSGSPQGHRMVAQAAALLTDRIEVGLEDDAPAVRVRAAGGQPLVAPDGEPITIQQFVADWVAAEGGHFLPASGDTGSGAHRGDGSCEGLSLERLDHNPRAKAEFIARHGPQAYVQLARAKR